MANGHTDTVAQGKHAGRGHDLHGGKTCTGDGATGRRATRHGGRKGCGPVCAPTMRERGGVAWGWEGILCRAQAQGRTWWGRWRWRWRWAYSGAVVYAVAYVLRYLSAHDGLAVAQRDMRGRGACRIVSVSRIVSALVYRVLLESFVGYALVWGTRALVDAIMRGMECPCFFSCACADAGA